MSKSRSKKSASARPPLYEEALKPPQNDAYFLCNEHFLEGVKFDENPPGFRPGSDPEPFPPRTPPRVFLSEACDSTSSARGALPVNRQPSIRRNLFALPLLRLLTLLIQPHPLTIMQRAGGRADGRMGGRASGWTEGRADGRTGGWTNERTRGRANNIGYKIGFAIDRSILIH